MNADRVQARQSLVEWGKLTWDAIETLNSDAVSILSGKLINLPLIKPRILQMGESYWLKKQERTRPLRCNIITQSYYHFNVCTLYTIHYTLYTIPYATPTATLWV